MMQVVRQNVPESGYKENHYYIDLGKMEESKGSWLSNEMSDASVHAGSRIL